MFSYIIREKNGRNVVVEKGNFKNYTEMLIDAGKHLQKNENTSEPKENLVLTCYENGKRLSR